MNDRSLFAPSPRRKRGLILTLSGSLLFHGSLIGVAAFWPTHPVDPAPVVTILGGFDNPPEPPGIPVPPAATPSEPDPVQPVLKITEPVDMPSPTVDPSAEEMTVATPVPHRAAMTTSHPAAPSTHNTGNSPAVGTANGVFGNPGPGRPGPTARWNTSKPVYPPSLRLAHVQGRGSVRITTDGTGRVVNATILQSTGNALLDDHTCRTAKTVWSGPANSTITVPITYQLNN